MDVSTDRRKGYLFSGLIGMILGGLLVIVSTNAIPKMMTRMMCGMMSTMMARMGADSLSPEEM